MKASRAQKAEFTRLANEVRIMQKQTVDRTSIFGSQSPKPGSAMAK